MKKTILVLLTTCCLSLLAEMRPLVDLAADVQKAKQDINAAIEAMGGVGTGGLTNAPQRIMAIPMPTGDYDMTYVAWSNVVKTVQYSVTNATYQLVEWLQSGKSQATYIDLGVYANQDTYVEIAVSNVTNTSSEHDLFGDRSNSSYKYGVHFYQSQVSFPYYSSWNDYKASATPSQTQLMVIQTDGNKLYIDGNLVFTATKYDFRTGSTLCVFTQNGNTGTGSYNLEGKVLWMVVKRAVDVTNSVLPDMMLIPAIGDNNKPCLLDIAVSPNKAYYLSAGTVSYSSPTNMYYDVSYIEFQAQCMVPYETNIVGNAENKLIEGDAIRYIYQKMADGE